MRGMQCQAPSEYQWSVLLCSKRRFASHCTFIWQSRTCASTAICLWIVTKCWYRLSDTKTGMWSRPETYLQVVRRRQKWCIRLCGIERVPGTYDTWSMKKPLLIIV
jgi:hypothetical protein